MNCVTSTWCTYLQSSGQMSCASVPLIYCVIKETTDEKGTLLPGIFSIVKVMFVKQL